jgi:dethiobiotin synthetase
LEQQEIDINKIKLPETPHLIVEGAGGLMVPINQKYLMIDLIKKFSIPVILVASSKLGTINHTLLSLEALRRRNIQLLGVIMSGELNTHNRNAIEYYGATQVLANLPFLAKINQKSLLQTELPSYLKQLFGV